MLQDPKRYREHCADARRHERQESYATAAFFWRRARNEAPTAEAHAECTRNAERCREQYREANGFTLHDPTATPQA